MAASIRSIPEILHDVLANIQDIVRAEVRLAKAELGDELSRARSGGLLIGVGAVAAIFSALFLLLACVYALSRVMPNWAAALIVAAVVGVAAAVTLGLGLKRFKTIQATPKTAASLQENVRWAKELTK
ncbi:MAG TPA: phage holin family protein [Steroidobacteraceae bacterium]|nr:phage holin family protein [Steroidobacteraceae bacterium]